MNKIIMTVAALALTTGAAFAEKPDADVIEFGRVQNTQVSEQVKATMHDANKVTANTDGSANGFGDHFKLSDH